jgi:hypothetical protein
MKKLLAIVVLGFLWSGSAYAKEVYLKKCYNPDREEKFNSKLFTNYYYKIDIPRKTMNGVTGWKPPKKVYVTYFKFDYLDNYFAKGFMTEADGQKLPSITVSVDIKKKLIIISSKSSVTVTVIKIQCE